MTIKPARIIMCVLAVSALWLAHAFIVKPNDDEYYKQKIILDDSSYIFLIHSGQKRKCIYYNPIIKSKDKIKSYHKHKNHLYCSYCWDDVEMAVLDACSYRNLWYGFLSEEAEEYYIMESIESPDSYDWWNKMRDQIIDSTSRRHYIQYGYKNGSMVLLSPSAVPEKYWYIRDEIERGANIR